MPASNRIGGVISANRNPKDKKQISFAEEAAGKPAGFLAEYWSFLRHSRKWWMIPALLVLALLGVLVILGGTGAAPFIYTLF